MTDRPNFPPSWSDHSGDGDRHTGANDWNAGGAPTTGFGAQPNQSGSGGPAPEPSQPIGFADARALFIGGGLLGTVLIGLVTVYQWLDPWQPFLIALIMGTLLSAAIALAYCNQGRAGAFVRGLLIWTALALPTGAWGVGEVRAEVLSLLGDRLNEQAQLNVVRDFDAHVLQSACATLSNSNSVAVRASLAERLAASPQAGSACLQALAAADESQASNLAANVLNQWQTDLAAGDAPRVCQTAPHLFEMSGTEPEKPTLPLTRCALGDASTEEAKTIAKCCADALVDHFESPEAYTSALGPTRDLPERILPSLFASMAPYVFPNINASRRPMPQLQNKLLRTKPTQDWLTELACNGLAGSSAADFIAGLDAISEVQGCGMYAGAERGVREWQQICRQWAAAPDEGLCPSLAEHAQAQAVELASARVHNALLSFYASETGRQILAGDAFLRRDDGTLIGFGERMAGAFDPSQLPPGYTNAQARHAARMFNGTSAAQMQVLREHAGRLSKSALENSDKVAQDLLQKELNPRARWSEVQHMAPAAERAEIQKKVDQAKKMIEQSDQPLNSPLTDIVR